MLGDVTQATIEEYQAIYRALKAHDQSLAMATALIHVNTSESWLRTLNG